MSAARARWAGRILVAIIAAVFAIDVAAVAREWSGLRPVATGAEAPDFSLPRIGPRGRLGPEALSLSSLRGQVVIIDFWETWCRPCRDAMPAIDRVAARHREDGVAFVSVCSDGTRQPAEARRLVDALAPRASLLADGGAIADRYGVGTIPHMVVVGRDGKVVHVHRRFTGAANLERDLGAAVEDALAQ